MPNQSTEPSTPKVPLEVPEWLQKQTRLQQAEAPYCGLGFKHGSLDPEIHGVLLDKLRASADQFKPEVSIPEIGTAQPRYIPALFFEDTAFNAAVSDLLKPQHEQWSGMNLVDSACYGFRAYQRGCYLHNHVDRGTTHIISSTLCIDSRLEEPWPLFIEDIYGEAHQINLRPGEFVFYEGARLIHGRPWPLVGDYYVGMFVHYRPAQQDA